MNKKYLLLASIVLLLGLGMLFMPDKTNDKQMQPELLLSAIDDPSRFLTTDNITDRLVKKDPALVLIDVRPAKQFEAFAIPEAINIPIDSILSASAQDILNQKEMDKVFYSNSDVTSDQAWILCKRAGMNRIYVLQGGINKWFGNIVKAEKPTEAEPTENMQLYQFRIAARQYFYGSNQTASQPSVEKKKVRTVKKTTEAASGGGC
ncbi:MAG: rhodanese-like domain-containing protein [Bacteroidales bacterium]